MSVEITFTFSDDLIARHIASCLPVDLDEAGQPIMSDNSWAKLQAVKYIKRGIKKAEKRKANNVQSLSEVEITDTDLTVE